MLRFSLISAIILWSLPIYAGGYIITGGVIGSGNGESLGFAALSLLDNNGTHRDALCDAAGKFHFDNISAGTYRITVSYIGYDKYEKTISVNSDLSLKVQMKMSANSLNEVVVTAFEANKGASLTKIDSKAMEHLQPSSFTDLLELLPGGKSENPNMGLPSLCAVISIRRTILSLTAPTSFRRLAAWTIRSLPKQSVARLILQ